MSNPLSKHAIPISLILFALLLIGVYLFKQFNTQRLPDGFTSGNGRIEATQIDVSSKNAGRIADILVNEGDWVKASQTLATMDNTETEAQLREAKADLRRNQESQKYAEAIVAQRKSELDLSKTELARSEKLITKGHISQDIVDQQRSKVLTSEAALQASSVQVLEAQAGIEAAQARIEALNARLADGILTAPKDGRVLYRLAEPGEIVAGGGRVLTLLNTKDVYMTIFLPTEKASLVHLGSSARIVLDALPETPIPATVSFVAAQSQFTPREVETRTEREKLMFRVKIKIDEKLLEKYADRVKTGVPGEAIIQLHPDALWPDYLTLRQPVR